MKLFLDHSKSVLLLSGETEGKIIKKNIASGNLDQSRIFKTRKCWIHYFLYLIVYLTTYKQVCSLSTLTYVLETDDSTNQELLKIVHRTGTTEIEMQKKELRYFRNIQEIHGSESVW